MTRSVVISSGSYLPEKTLSNDEISKIVDTNDEWIVERTGIKIRHIAADGELTSDLAAKAALNALEKANLTGDDIDLIILATTTPDNTFPSTATRVQNLIGMKYGAAFDIQAVCTGFIYALATADSFIKSGQYKRILVIGAETLSRILDWTDRGTCILFGDGAGAVILEAQENTDRGILSCHLHSDGTKRDLLYVDGGVSLTQSAGTIKMQGQEVFKHAVTKLAKCTVEALDYNSLEESDIDWLIPHQANIRILEATAKKLGAPKGKLIATVGKHANTSASSIPLAIDDAVTEGKIKKGDLLALQGIGGGLTWGASLVRW